MHEFFNGRFDDTDGYVRISTKRTRPTRTNLVSSSANGLLFVDIDGDADVDRVVRALQHLALPLTERVLFRWPEINNPPEKINNIQEWLIAIRKSELLTTSGSPRLGVVVFSVSSNPSITWASESESKVESPSDSLLTVLTDRDDSSDEIILIRALRAELRSLLEWGHAIWQPRNYHYELPSGDHTDSFIRIADAFRTLRDVEAISTWFTPYLSDGVAIIMDSASLIPLATELKSIAIRAGLTIAGVETLDEYPRTKLDILQAILSVGAHDQILTIMSVSASGRYLDLIHDALSVFDQSKLIIIVDKQADMESASLTPRALGDVDMCCLLGFGRMTTKLAGERCELCTQHEISQTVRIDPRSFEAVALPDVQLMMPDYEAAVASRDFFTACDKLEAIEISTYSEEYVRSKSGPMGVRFLLDRLIANTDFQKLLTHKIQKLPKISYDHLIISAKDLARPGFQSVIDSTCTHYSISTEAITSVEIDDQGYATYEGDALATARHALILSVGSVSGWLLRRLQLVAQDAWQKANKPGKLTAIVVHAQSATEREWENLFQSFERRLYALWHMYLPSQHSPIFEESELLSNLDFSHTKFENNSFSVEASAFVANRKSLNSARKGPGPDVLWGSSNTSQIRNQSLYGLRLSAVATYAAVGSAMQAKRKLVKNTDPRWSVFDFSSISRSYYDGLLVSCMLRWTLPHEVWWGRDPHARLTAVLALVGGTRELADQLVLFPELLYAAIQGKIPEEVIGQMCQEIVTETGSWHREDRLPIAVGVHLLQKLGKPVDGSVAGLALDGLG